MTSILITGGLGFVGTALVKLLKHSYDITILDNYLSGPINLDIPIYKGDIRNKILLQYLVPQFDIIVHLAGIVGAPSCDINKQLSHAVNIESTEYLVSLMDNRQKFIFISSTSSYGKQSGTVTECNPLLPLTSYGIHKAVGEEITINGKPKYIILRPATAFGVSERIRVDLLPNTLAYLALTKELIDIFEPNVIRPFIHVHDFAQIIKHAIDNNMPWNEIYNIGDPYLTMTKGHIAQIFAEWGKSKIIIREGSDPDQRNYAISFDKLLSTGFKFKPGRLLHGFSDIKNNLEKLKLNPNIYTTTYNTQQFILSEEVNAL